MNKLISFVAAIVIISTSLCVAQQPLIDVVYLKNGSIIKGEILEVSQDRKVKIQTTDNKIWVFEMDEIIEIKKEKGHFNHRIGEYLSSSYINFSSMGLLVGSENANHSAPFSVSMVNGYLLTNKLSVGIGFGLEFLDVTSAPLYADFRYFINTKKISPFVSFQSGFSFPIEDDRNNYYQQQNNKPGYLLNPGIGFLVNFNSGSALIFSAGYRHQALKYEYNDHFDTRLTQFYNRFNIRFGLAFQ